MTEVEFHTGVADPLDFACRLLRKAYRRGVRVLVIAPPQRLQALDRLLWTFDERDFVPHLRVPSPDADMAARTPIWLATPPAPPGAPATVVNLGATQPLALQGVDRLIEVVGTEPDEVQDGRVRWRAYKAAGLTVVHHAAGGP